jgi:hypothetical protein
MSPVKIKPPPKPSKLDDDLEDDLYDKGDSFRLADNVRSQTKRKRCITLANAKTVVDFLKSGEFKKLKSFIDEIEKTVGAAEKIRIQKGDETEALSDAFESLNARMKAKDGKLYKQLMVKLYDSHPKKEEFQNVSVKKSLIERLKKVKENENPVIKDLVNWALDRFLKTVEPSIQKAKTSKK